MTYLPYSGAAPVVNALLGDHVTAGLMTYSTASEHLNAGKNAELAALGFYSVGICGTDFAHLLRKQYDEFGRVIREANVKAE